MTKAVLSRAFGERLHALPRLLEILEWVAFEDPRTDMLYHVSACPAPRRCLLIKVISVGPLLRHLVCNLLIGGPWRHVSLLGLLTFHGSLSSFPSPSLCVWIQGRSLLSGAPHALFTRFQWMNEGMIIVLFGASPSLTPNTWQLCHDSFHSQGLLRT